MGNAIGLGCSEVHGAETGVCIDSTGTMDNDKPGKVEGKIDIIARKKQTNPNSEIYYTMHLSKNRTPTMPDKTNKTLLLFSS